MAHRVGDCCAVLQEARGQVPSEVQRDPEGVGYVAQVVGAGPDECGRGKRSRGRRRCVVKHVVRNGKANHAGSDGAASIAVLTARVDHLAAEVAMVRAGMDALIGLNKLVAYKIIGERGEVSSGSSAVDEIVKAEHAPAPKAPSAGASKPATDSKPKAAPAKAAQRDTVMSPAQWVVWLESLTSEGHVRGRLVEMATDVMIAYRVPMLTAEIVQLLEPDTCTTPYSLGRCLGRESRRPGSNIRFAGKGRFGLIDRTQRYEGPGANAVGGHDGE